jgi:hypothetical protein
MIVAAEVLKVSVQTALVEHDQVIQALATKGADHAFDIGTLPGCLTERCNTPIWWRNARITNWGAARLRNEAASEAIRAVNMCPRGNRTMSDNSQSISAIGVYENHRSHRRPRR